MSSTGSAAGSPPASNGTASTATNANLVANVGGALDNRLKDISNSPAFTFLDSLARAGKLNGGQVEFYKMKYQKLHEVVIATYQNEKLLLDKAKELKGILEAERIKLENRTIMSHDTQSDIEILLKEEKEWLSKVNSATDERNSITYEYDELSTSKKEQKESLEEKYKKSLSALDPLVNTLTGKIEELKAEIEKQQEMYNKESNAQQEYLDKIDNSNKSIANLEKEKMKKRAAYQQAMGEPERLKTNIAMMESVAKDLEEEGHKLLEEIKSKESELAGLQEQRRVVHTEIEELGLKLEQFRLAMAKRKTSLDEYKRAREIEEQKRDMTIERTKALDLSKKEQKDALRNNMASLNEYHKAVEGQKKLYEKLRRKKDTVQSIQKPLIQQIDMCKRQLEEMEYQYRTQKAMLLEIKQDEELFISQYLAQEKLEEDTSDLLFGVQADQKEYEEKIKILDKEERELQQAISQLSAQRELMAREASKATQQYKETKEELKVKNLILLDLDKQTLETFQRLKNCSLKYEKMKNQKNKLANLTQASAQALAEMKEKIKILQNEVEILRAECLAKDKAYTEEMRLHQAAQNERDAQRVEQNKYIHDLRLKKEDESQQMMEIIKLNHIINQAELQMMSLRKDYAHAVDNRNLTGIQLIDRNDELCILYEKQNIQANILKSGDEQLAKLEEEIKLMERDIAEVKRRIEAARKKIPSLDTYAATMRSLQTLESELNKERQLAQTLSEKLETPSAPAHNLPHPDQAGTVHLHSSITRGDHKPEDEKENGGASSSSSASQNGQSMSGTSSALPHPSRSRLLKGIDPDADQLTAKIDVLEERLNDKKEQLLEKELVLDEVTSLSDKLRIQAAETRGSTLELAKKINEVRAKIRHKTRQMMASVSELSMYQANAMRLEVEKAEKEKVLALARERLAQDLPPTDDAEHEWIRLERDRLRKQELLLDGARERAEAYQQAQEFTIRSTAEPRPNAYIPEEMAIPKPYGSMAPFKPTLLGTNFRHIKPPKPQEIHL